MVPIPPASPSPDFLIPALSAFVGLLTGLMVQWWRASRDELRELCNDLVDILSTAIDAGSEFRLSEPSTERQIRVEGLQRQIAGFNAVLTGRLHSGAHEDIDLCLAALFDALSGGDFDDPTRKPNLSAARNIQDKGADAILAVRRGFFETASLKEKMHRLVAKSPLPR